MLAHGRNAVGGLTLSVLVVGVALLACKKSGGDTAPSASATPPPPPASVEPEATASAAPADDASTATPTPTATTTTTVKVTTKLDAGVKDAGTTVDASAPTNTTADANAIQACCGALSTAAKAGGQNGNKYKSAAAVCSGIAAQVKKGSANAAAARTQIRALLVGVPVPGGC